MPDGVVAAVEAMATNEQQPIIRHGAPFLNGHQESPLRMSLRDRLLVDKQCRQ